MRVLRHTLAPITIRSEYGSAHVCEIPVEELRQEVVNLETIAKEAADDIKKNTKGTFFCITSFLVRGYQGPCYMRMQRKESTCRDYEV